MCVDLGSNALEGPIPVAIASLTELTYLDFSYNKFTSTVPAGIAALTKLQYLLLQSNDISGDVHVLEVVEVV
jgi:Leucine-rich repeat (LRR) protein